MKFYHPDNRIEKDMEEWQLMYNEVVSIKYASGWCLIQVSSYSGGWDMSVFQKTTYLKYPVQMIGNGKKVTRHISFARSCISRTWNLLLSCVEGFKRPPSSAQWLEFQPRGQPGRDTSKSNGYSAFLFSILRHIHVNMCYHCYELYKEHWCSLTYVAILYTV